MSREFSLRRFEAITTCTSRRRASLASIVAVLAAAMIGSHATAEPLGSVVYSFTSADDLANWAVHADGEASKRMPKPKIHDGKLYLLESWWKSSATAAGPAPTEQLARQIEISFTLIMNTGTEGAGFAWLDISEHQEQGPAPQLEQWESPNVQRGLGIGFDASNPVNRDPFRGSGNIYDHPQHEVSLHWDGMEIVKRTTPMDFRDEKPHVVRIGIEFVTGGAEITVIIDEQVIYERYFLASMTAFIGRPAFGATNLETAGDVLIDDLTIECRDRIEPPAPPVRIVAIERALNDHAHPRNESMAEFPSSTDEFGRIICTLLLDKPETRFDPWDRLAHVWVYDEDGQRFELLRYITPYHKGHEWKVDVTDFRPLLTGTRRIVQECSTQGEGWVVTVAFDFYPGPADRFATQVINLWSGNPEIGNPDKPVSAFYKPRTNSVDDGVTSAKVRMVVTGHGMNPNSRNAAEFMPIDRTLTVNGQSWTNRLWKTDNYLNPCRPQGGTWKYDRAGWAPGDVVRPWDIDVSHLLNESRKLRIAYELDEYINENRGKSWAPTHVTEAQLILYRDAVDKDD